MNAAELCCVIRHHRVSSRSFKFFSLQGGCGWQPSLLGYWAENRRVPGSRPSTVKNTSRLPLTKPTTAHIGSCDELVNHPEVDLPLATCTVPMTPKGKKHLRRQTFLCCHEGLHAPGLCTNWRLSGHCPPQNVPGTIFALWQGKLSC